MGRIGEARRLRIKEAVELMVKKAAEATPNQLLWAARKDRNWTQNEVSDRIGAPVLATWDIRF
jgi:hypothetical protein